MSIIALVAAATLLTVYFQGFLGIETVFTHFFYIPIILGALWWGRAGMGVALLLGAVLLTSHLYYRPDYSIYKDFFRSAIFLIVSGVVILLRSRIRSTEIKLQNQTKVLETRVRSLNCLYDINKLREAKHIPLGEIFLETVKLIEKAFAQIPIKVIIYYEGSVFKTEAIAAYPIRMTSAIEANGNPAGAIEASWSEEGADYEDVSKAVPQLIESVARRLGKIVEHENVRLELSRHQLGLEDLVRKRTEELNATNQRLREEIAEREKIENSLRESEMRYRLLIENADQAIFISQNNQILFANPGLCALTGYPIESLLKMSLLDFIHPEDRETVAANYHNGLSDEKSSQMIAFRIQTADEALRWVELDIVNIQWKGHHSALNFLRDITSRKRLEASIGQIRKMEAIGTLAGGIAHQFNNALAGIIGNIDLLKISLPDNPQVQKCGNTALQCAQSMSGLTQQLLAYARGGKYQSRPHSLNFLIKEVLLQLSNSANKSIHFDTALSPDTPLVEMDTIQIRMVILAVINNAAEAIAENGHIGIETYRARFDEIAAEAFPGLPSGEYAGLSILDDGKGMSEEVKEHIFEPFFTTKFLGRGMGMAAAYGIIKNHGGYIYVDSESGRGTVVHILLPPCPHS